MRVLVAAVWCVLACPLWAQQVCPPVPAYSLCELTFELNDEEAAAHPEPYRTVELHAEVRSPRARTFLAPAFWDGGRKLVIRFAPGEPGQWDFRVTSNIKRFHGKTGQVEVTASNDAGFLMPANVHHWRLTESMLAHLWMGDVYLPMATAPQAEFDALLAARAKQKFTHIRASLYTEASFDGSGLPVPSYFQQLDARIAACNAKGIFVDLIVAPDPKQFSARFGNWQDRERFLRYIVSRYGPYHITWQIFGSFEDFTDGRSLLKEIGEQIRKLDPYRHPRSTGAKASAAPALNDGWMNYVVHHTNEDAIGAIEHQLFPVPFVNAGIMDGGAAPEEFRRRLWNSFMNGQYPVANLDSTQPESANAKAMEAWFDFTARTRYWELEPYFDVDGGRAVMLPGVEYVVYIEKPGPVEILVEKHGYDVFWFNPATGELTKEKKEFKGERYSGQPPTRDHDWVLHLSREGRKEGMLRSYKFESRPNLMQEIELNPQKMPFEILEPLSDELAISKPVPFEVQIKRETRGTRQMQYVWTAEVPTEGRGYRIVATGAKGMLQIPAVLADKLPAVLNLRVYALNAVGKVYAMDKVFRLVP